MSHCKVCKHPVGTPIDSLEREDSDGYVVYFEEYFECDNCGAEGTLIHDDRGAEVPRENRYGKLFEGRARVTV